MKKTINSINTSPNFFLYTTVSTHFGVNAEAYSVAVQSDGKILVAGNAGYNFALARFNEYGILDTSFDVDGKVTTDFGQSGFYSGEGFKVILQTDNKILMSGRNFNLARYNGDGSLDVSFGNGGKVTTDFEPNVSDFFSLSSALQADGKILVAGYRTINFDSDFVLMRYNGDGSLDTSFNGNGKVATDFGSDDYGQVVALQSDGKILVGGTTENYSANSPDYALARYNSDGSLDTSFSGDGIQTTDFGGSDFIESITIQTDGKILAAGTNYNYNTDSYQFELARYNKNGSLDTSFSGDGKVKTALVSVYNKAHTVLLQADGKILVVGSSQPKYYSSQDIEYENDVTLVRYNTDGSLDTSFGGGDGVVSSIFAKNLFRNPGNYSATLLPDGKIVVSGSIVNRVSNGEDFAVVRYNGDGSLDTSFGLTNTLGNKITTTNGAYPVVLNDHANISDTELDALNRGLGDYSGASITLMRHGGANSEDIFSGDNRLSLENNIVKIDGKAIGTCQQSAGKLTINFTAASSFDVDRALQHIGYANTSHHPASTVQIDWIFTDGDSTHPLSTVGSTTVAINLVNHTPEGHVMINGTPILGQMLTASNDLSDIDGLGVVSYQWQARLSGGSWSNVSTGDNILLTQDLFAQQLKVIASYKDGTGFINSVYSVIGTSGDDLIFGSNGNQVLYGGIGNDRLLGGRGSDILNGGDGNDTLKGDFNLFSSDGFNTTDVLNGGDGNDVLIYSGNFAKEILDGGNGVDWANFGNVDLQLGVFLNEGRVYTSLGTEGIILNIENVVGSIQGSNIIGNALNNVIIGRNGEDWLEGGDGNDTLIGGEGYNSLDGGNGIDIVNYWNTAGSVTVNLSLTDTPNTLGAGIADTLSNIENINGSAFNDSLTGNALNNALFGGAGNDTLNGADGADSLRGDAGDDVINGGDGSDIVHYWNATARVFVNLGRTDAQNTMGAGIDTLLNIENVNGSAFNDNLIGNALTNRLLGGTGNDSLNGSLGSDVLTGGQGQDSFVFNSALGTSNKDIITDFTVVDDTIKLENSVFTAFASTGVLAANAFKIIGGENTVDSDDRILYNTVTGGVSYDVDGSGSAAAVLVAIIGKGLAVTEADFVVI